jgi:hypothetical protein
MGWFFQQPLGPPFVEVAGGFVLATFEVLQRGALLSPSAAKRHFNELGLLVGRVAAFVGLVVFVSVALDPPFQGAVTPSEEGFRLIASRSFGGQ